MNSEQQSPTRAAVEGDSLSKADPACVLLVEDDRSVRRYLEVTLQRSGYKVIAAADGLEAMKLALSSTIDAVVTDAIMPHLSGQQLAGFLRGNPKLAQTPIILLTGQESKAGTPTADNLIDSVLHKPINTQELVQCLQRLIKR